MKVKILLTSLGLIFVWPGLNFKFKDVTIKIHGLEVTNIKSTGKPGDLYEINKSGIYFNTRDIVIVITYLQFPNKNPISSLDAYNSHREFFK